MYDELIKALHEGAEFLECSTPGIKNSFAKMCHNAADAIGELICEVADEHNGRSDAEERQRWIPVTERLPEDLTRVIVFCEDGVSFGLCEHLIADDEEVVEWHDFLHYPITPTHWMPLPEPPKEE
jgi:hypothetical protein